MENKETKKNKKNKTKTKKAKQKKKTQQQPSLSFRAGVLVNKFIFNLIYWSSYSDFPSSIEKKNMKKEKKKTNKMKVNYIPKKKYPFRVSSVFEYIF